MFLQQNWTFSIYIKVHIQNHQPLADWLIPHSQPFQHLTTETGFQKPETGFQKPETGFPANIQLDLLGSKVKVEPGLEPVELELAGREELPGGGGGGEGVESGLGRLTEGGLLGGRLLNTSLVTGKKTALVRGIKGVDEWVDSGAVGTGRHTGKEVVGNLAVVVVVPGGKIGSVDVVLEVPVGGVVRVDEGVEVGVHRGVDIVVVQGGSNRGRGSGSGGNKSGRGRSGVGLTSLGSIKGSRVETVGTGRDMGSFQDPESILASGVPHGDGLAVISNVAVLSNPLPVGGGLLPEDGAVLLGIG